MAEYDIKDFEKRIEQIEKELDEEVKQLKARTREKLKELEYSFRMLKDILIKMNKERGSLERDRNFLLEKHKELIRQLPVDKSKLKRDIREQLLMPLQRRMKENAELIKNVAVEGLEKKPAVKQEQKKDTFIDKPKTAVEKKAVKPKEKDYIKEIKSAVVSEETKTPMDELFELVMNQGTVRLSDAARKFGVTEVQLEEWAKILEGHDLIELHYPAIGRPELRKKAQE